MFSDIEIARQAKLRKISEIAAELGLNEDSITLYGQYKAKIDLNANPQLQAQPDGKLILVTAISPSPAGEGKTTTTVGLGDALQRMGKRAVICLREPSMGPVFGMKGGAAGGGYAQVVPMEDINLHFTGDFASIALAHNLLAAMIDNHIHHGNALQIDPRQVTWKRVIDMNDRALRQVVIGLGGKVNGQPREDGFDIVVASEVMAVFCLADSLKDLRTRLGRIVVGYTYSGQPVTAQDLKAHGAMTVLLKDAIKPNLVQTLEHTPALLHGGPFANIAHGCNSVIATRTALKLGDYVVTEAGFGADLGAEKFIDIKCRKAGLHPDACVIVATIRALKYHGGADVSALSREDMLALDRGIANLEKHVENVTTHYGMPAVIALNRFDHDTEAELALVMKRMGEMGIKVVVAEHWAKGGAGAESLAAHVLQLIEGRSEGVRYVYESSETLWEKVNQVARKIYGAMDVHAPRPVRAMIDRLQDAGYGHYPICIAKTQYSFSTDASRRGVPHEHILTVRAVRLCAGAEFVVIICDDIMTMPGLPEEPCAIRMDIDDDGQVVGLY
ncbi:formate--tetrahydrofolate ligase [Methylobacillus flagellatus]|uniref:Formate--tetrahydrofolate ligase n=1 Tax=Methylobacillus flagellatus (strain ATCC 51484 / DSM 6875 / VKM B-1610 / KT) TaxID=265072 RepID=FTHS_METFK|nr:formate--tetrahydrofolate ligase [Methylobacillus flagellatus]Q1GZ16.1 RecName: Full=Formate--tetrahydrofolate ligase; AltName: Full=Formyltetrahydrofolate synthetase; Short=FHS; Short=FTHFS [Methylobacillus flagellatus KT]ABE50521.1 Formate-tetrahydrofolate ligase [Methylobacillus flagellatus KT]